ncbi:MAG: hypothetical protein ACTHOD_13040 [Motilibacteraceae bacterium]
MRPHVTWLAPLETSVPAPDLNASDHPSRAALAKAERDAGSDGWQELRDIYTAQAPEWAAWVSSRPDYLDPLRALLRHQRLVAPVVELCGGTGEAAALLAGAGYRTLWSDLLPAMLTHAVTQLPMFAADVRALPVATGAVGTLVVVNGPAWAPEVKRALGEGGMFVSCSTFGAKTPVYTSPGRWSALLGPEWQVTAQRVGEGEWLVARRGLPE